MCCLAHTIPNAACNAVGVAFCVEEANRADSTFKGAEMLTPVTNPRFCDCDCMHAACMQISENTINRLRRLTEQTPSEVDAKPWTLGGDCLWDFDRACIYVLVCINAPGRGLYYCIIHLFTLSRVIVYPSYGNRGTY